jgi:hypothetical protein
VVLGLAGSPQKARSRLEKKIDATHTVYLQTLFNQGQMSAGHT